MRETVYLKDNNMPQYFVTYTDYTEVEPVTKTETLGSPHIDDIECNLFRKTRCDQFTILTIQELKGNFLNKH